MKNDNYDNVAFMDGYRAGDMSAFNRDDCRNGIENPHDEDSHEWVSWNAGFDEAWNR